MKGNYLTCCANTLSPTLRLSTKYKTFIIGAELKAHLGRGFALQLAVLNKALHIAPRFQSRVTGLNL